MDKATILKIIETLHDIYKTSAFSREALLKVFLDTVGRVSRATYTRDSNLLIDLGLIELVVYPNFRLTKTAFKLLKDAEAILPSDYLKASENSDKYVVETAESDLDEYLTDKTVIVEVPKEKQPKKPEGD